MEQAGKKRSRSTPTGGTPRQPGKKSVSRTSGTVLAKANKKLSLGEQHQHCAIDKCTR